MHPVMFPSRCGYPAGTCNFSASRSRRLLLWPPPLAAREGKRHPRSLGDKNLMSCIAFVSNFYTVASAAHKSSAITTAEKFFDSPLKGSPRGVGIERDVKIASGHGPVETFIPGTRL